jgi:hypothetical protein
MIEKYLCFVLGHLWKYHSFAPIRQCKRCKEKQSKQLGTYISPIMMKNKWKIIKEGGVK